MKENTSIARGMIVLSIAGILVKVLSILYTPALKSILTTAGYGIYTQTTQVFVFVYAIACMGAQPALAKVVSEYTAVGKHKSAVRALSIARKVFMTVGVIMALLMLVLAVPIANFAENPDIAYGIVALAPCIVITTYLATIRGYMQGKNNMKSIAISQIIEQIINIVVSLLAAFILIKISIQFSNAAGLSNEEIRKVSIKFGNAGAQVGTSTAALIASIYLLFIFIKNKYKHNAIEENEEKSPSDKRILRKIITYSFPIILSAGLQNFGGLIDMFNVSKRLLYAGFDDTTRQVLYGYLGMYNTLYGVPIVIITAVAMSTLPAISRLYVLRDKKEIRRKIRETFKLTYIIAIPAAVGLSVVSKDIYISLFGRDEGSSLMAIGAFIIILMATTQIQASVLQSINKMYYMIGTFIIGLICKVILNYIFVGIPTFNIYGVLIGNFFWQAIPAVLNHRKICKTAHMKIPIIKLVARPALASLFMALTIYIIQLPYSVIYRFVSPSRITSIPITVVAVIAGGFVYLYMMIVMGGIRKNDLEAISPKIIRILPRFIRKKLR